jgi:magnesium transporter
METDLELARAFMESHPEKAAMSLEQVPVENVTALLSEAPVEIAARVIVHMAPYFGVECLKSLPVEFAGEVFGLMPRDHSALVLRRMRPEDRKRLLDAAPPSVSSGLGLLLRFPEYTAGALMDPDVLSLPSDISVGDALNRVRHSGARIFYYVYIIDRERRLTGVINLRELIEASEVKLLEDVMHVHVARLSVHADLIAIRAHPGWLEYHALPVVDNHAMLVGVLRYRTLRAAVPDIGPLVASSPLGASLALGELYWSTLGHLLQTVWPAANPTDAKKSEEADER